MSSILRKWLDKLKTPERNLELERKVQEMFPQPGMIVNGRVVPSDMGATLKPWEDRMKERFPRLVNQMEFNAEMNRQRSDPQILKNQGLTLKDVYNLEREDWFNSNSQIRKNGLGTILNQPKPNI